jgi:hypothetical protein
MASLGDSDARVRDVDQLAEQADRIDRRVASRHGPLLGAKRVQPINIGDTGLPDQILHSNRRTSKREGGRTATTARMADGRLLRYRRSRGGERESRSTATPQWVGGRAMHPARQNVTIRQLHLMQLMRKVLARCRTLSNLRPKALRPARYPRLGPLGRGTTGVGPSRYRDWSGGWGV